MLRKIFKNKKGFTLVELMIVVVIMGILVAVAIPVYNNITKRAHRNTCHTNCEVLEKAATQYLVDTGAEDISGIVAGDGSGFSSDGDSITITNNTEFETNFSDGYKAGVNRPLEIFQDDCKFTFFYANGGKNIRVVCSEHGDKAGNDVGGSPLF